MASKTFRSALNGFNRQDVVHYIEYMNHQHNSQIAQLNTQLQEALSKAPQGGDLAAQLQEAQAKCAALEQTVAELETKLAQQSAAPSGDELETYRRAERTERMAQERAQQIYNQANAVLAEASLKVDTAAAQIGAIADQVTGQLRQYQDAVSGTKAAFQEAVTAMYAIRPEEE